MLCLALVEAAERSLDLQYCILNSGLHREIRGEARVGDSGARHASANPLRAVGSDSDSVAILSAQEIFCERAPRPRRELAQFR